VRVVRRGKTGTDVEELTDTRISRQERDDAPEERTIGSGDLGDQREHRRDLIRDSAVDLEVVLATEPAVPDPRIRGNCLVDPVLDAVSCLVAHGPAPVRWGCL
jgi:hypothetical protein